jgi:hypothetical protein
MREHVLLFCLLGLVLTATIVLVTAPGAVTWHCPSSNELTLARGSKLHFLDNQRDVAHTSLPIRPSKVQHSDIDPVPGGATWHRNQNELGSHLPSEWFLRWR